MNTIRHLLSISLRESVNFARTANLVFTRIQCVFWIVKKTEDHELVKNAPRMYDYLNDESKNYFETVKAKLDDLNIAYEVDYNLVRGLDYYTHTAFELMSNADGFGAITTLCGGGRYNGLLEMMDGPDKTGIGFALSIERLILALEAEGIDIPNEKGLDLYVCTMTDEARDLAGTLLHKIKKPRYQCRYGL